jgi:hypothetical protein
MSHTPHELTEEFPENLELISKMKQQDAHFARLAEEYEEINKAIHRAETLVEPTGDLHESEMRKKRLAILDELAKVLREAAD